ncbi:hypothetical protein SGPA1_50549 [Streptomyces misionensis JCM 4497]
MRQVRHRLHPGRGHGRIRPYRRVVRGRSVRRHPGPDDLRQGRELRLRPARRRRHLPGDRRDLRQAPLPGRSDLLRAPVGLRRRRRHDQRDGRGGRGGERQAARRDGAGPRPRRPGGPPPERGRGPRHRHVLGAGAGQGPGDPRAAGAVQRGRRGERADGRVRRRRQEARPVALREHEPHPCGAAVQHRRGRAEGGPGRPRRRAGRRGRVHGVTVRSCRGPRPNA